MSDLLDRWQANNHRPTWVRENRDELNDATELSEPVPDGSVFEIRRWLERYKGTVTRQLNDDEPGTDPHDDATGETTTTKADETGN